MMLKKHIAMLKVKTHWVQIPRHCTAGWVAVTRNKGRAHCHALLALMSERARSARERRSRVSGPTNSHNMTWFGTFYSYEFEFHLGFGYLLKLF